MKNILNNLLTSLVALLLLVATDASVAQTPPTKVPQADGTIQLVPVPPAVVFTPYFIDPTIGYRVLFESGYSNKDWDGRTKNGLLAKKGDVIEARILAQPISKTKIVDGKTVYLWSIFRSGDFVVSWDSAKFELLPITTMLDASVFNNAKSGFVAPDKSGGVNEAAVPADGNALYHVEVLPAPENRVPALQPLYYQWNFNGYMWQSAYRVVGTLKFKVKGDFYYPTSQLTDIKILPSITVNGIETKTKIDGSPVVGTNILSETRNAVNQIKFGAPQDYKISQKLSAPTTKFKVGDTIPVKILIKNETLPQRAISVSSIFAWDNTKLEFMGINTTGARASMMNKIDLVDPRAVNEAVIPKDGNAWHNWLCQLGDKTYIDKENLIVILNFKVIAPFDATMVELIEKSDPRIAGLFQSDQTGILGSDTPGVFVTGQKTNAIIFGLP